MDRHEKGQNDGMADCESKNSVATPSTSRHADGVVGAANLSNTALSDERPDDTFVAREAPEGGLVAWLSGQ